ncbi:MAG: methyl viologen-reducing hydrogenase [Desulfobulbus sp.]|nr:methyl viologen-reducing hydrogenase [Desulfobulbus sp.]
MNDTPPRPRLSCESLHACSGCEVALINSGDLFLGLLEQVAIVHFPLIMDHKYAGGAKERLDLPQAEIGLVSGGVATKKHLEILRTMRAQCQTLVAFGTCATHGGIPALRNQWTAKQAFHTIFHQDGDESSATFDDSSLLDRVYSIDEQVEVDLFLPGCPPHPETIIEAVGSLVSGQQPHCTEKSVCEHCPMVRTGTSQPTVRRFLNNADYDPAEPVSATRCLLEQGLLCMGPVTASGCGGRETPQCIRARVPCRGCYGPVRRQSNQLLDILNALASKGIDYRTIVDRQSLLRFSGAHGLLKPRIRG